MRSPPFGFSCAQILLKITDKRGVNLICDTLPFGRLWYGEPNAVNNAIGHAEHRSRSHDAVIRVYDAADNVIEMHEDTGEFLKSR